MKEDEKINRVQSSTIVYNRVQSMCLDMEIGEKVLLSDRIRPENRNLVVEILKSMIREKVFPDFYMEFSDDYSMIKKKQR